MSTIGGPGGIGGPKGPGGASGAGGADELGDVGDVGDVGDIDGADATSALSSNQLDALAGDIASGKLTAREAIDKLVDQAGIGLPADQRAELREMLDDLVANDPYLSGLANRA